MTDVKAETKVGRTLRAWEIRDREPKTPALAEKTTELLHAALQDAVIAGVDPLMISALADAIKKTEGW